MARGGGIIAKDPIVAKDPLVALIIEYGKTCEGKPDCGRRDGGGAAHKCRCAWCQGFKRLQLKIKALRRRVPPSTPVVRVRKITRLR